MYDVVYISLSLPYTVDIHVEMYAVKEIQYKYINLKLNEHQDGRQIQDVCSKLNDATYQRFCSERLYSISGYQMQLSGYVGNIHGFKIIMRHKFHL